MGWTNFGIVVSLAAVSVITAIYLAKKWSLQHQPNQTCRDWRMDSSLRNGLETVVELEPCTAVVDSIDVRKLFEKNPVNYVDISQLWSAAWSLSLPIALISECEIFPMGFFHCNRLVKLRIKCHCSLALTQFLVDLSGFVIQWLSCSPLSLCP